jgi:predicted P-loop ATPase
LVLERKRAGWSHWSHSFAQTFFLRGGFDVAKIVKLPVPALQSAEEHARAETERRQRLFAWAEVLFKELGLDKALAAARSLEDLRGITFNVDSDQVILAIRAALHPVSGDRAEHFRGLTEKSLRQILRNRFAEWKKVRTAALRGKQSDRDWEERLKLNERGQVIANLANLTLILEEGWDWKGVLAYNQFNARVVIRKQPPFELAVLTIPWIDIPWTDHFESQTRIWFQHQNISPSMGDVGRAVQKAARRNSFHPVRGYLETLRWDGVPRIGTWLQTYFHVEDTEYARAVGPRWLISGVARIYRPGCKVDHVLILEGPQGKYKSEALRTIAVRDEWFVDRINQNLANRNAAIELGGVWIVEIAELEELLRAPLSTQKTFISRRHDHYVPPYGKLAISQPRQNIFAGTINPPANGYLKDPTGARRFWPAGCRGMIDLDGLMQARDQLWAEAMALFQAGMPWWLETPKLEALATAEQDARYVVDPWDEIIREWRGDRTDVSIKEVLEHALRFEPKHQTQRAETRVAQILRKQGGEKYRGRTPEGKRPNRYWFPPKR